MLDCAAKASRLRVCVDVVTLGTTFVPHELLHLVES